MTKDELKALLKDVDDTSGLIKLAQQAAEEEEIPDYRGGLITKDTLVLAGEIEEGVLENTSFSIRATLETITLTINETELVIPTEDFCDFFYVMNEIHDALHKALGSLHNTIFKHILNEDLEQTIGQLILKKQGWN